MRQFRRFLPRVAMLFSMIAASLTIAASPASAHTLEDVVSAPAGCSWLDGSYSTLHTSPITTPSGTRYGTAYLLWSNTYQQNCAITLKTSYHGTPTWTTTTIWTQQDGGRTYEQGNFGHYTRAVRAAAGQCVRYIATISSTAGSTGGTTATGGRSEWGNCT
ncbi:hypothetical protein ACIRPH_09555 [Nocardiopsis sp. NPDC101807]|uniref:hypothetical protein n=1 Tax=Nocardiopsis sp. NPDC101807 TaxID=3364339 RepID=UPI00382DB355